MRGSVGGGSGRGKEWGADFLEEHGRKEADRGLEEGRTRGFKVASDDAMLHEGATERTCATAVPFINVILETRGGQ